MKPFASHKGRGYPAKLSTVTDLPGITILHPDGTLIPDKTAGLKTRKSHKRMIRNANRAKKKGARQKLKKEIAAEL